MGCSSGEEAYSLAMVGERFLTPVGKRYAVTGTDISTIVLRKARAGRYLPRALQWVPQAYAAIGFKPQQAGEPLQITDELRQRSCFSQVNILNLAACPLQSQHVIYCQNVLIYFRRWRRQGNPERAGRTPGTGWHSGDWSGRDGGLPASAAGADSQQPGIRIRAEKTNSEGGERKAMSQDYIALEWVKGEIEETLQQAQQALEAYVENPQDKSRLKFCLSYLHQIQVRCRWSNLWRGLVGRRNGSRCLCPVIRCTEE